LQFIAGVAERLKQAAKQEQSAPDSTLRSRAQVRTPSDAPRTPRTRDSDRTR
jgi:hypothetical protein